MSQRTHRSRGHTLRILHVPSNIASILSHNVRAQRELGADARGFAISESGVLTSYDGLGLIDYPFGRRNAYKWPLLAAWYLDQVRRSDIVHWYYETALLPRGIDLRLVKFLGVPACVEWFGSDVRDPAVEFVDNPAYLRAWEDGWEYRDSESTEHSRSVQQRFLAAGFVPLVAPGMWQYLLPEAVAIARPIARGLLLDEYTPVYPSPKNAHVRVVHAPSAPVCKGTAYVLAALDRLRGNFDFELVLVERMPREQALKAISTADVFIDQLICGDYGMASVEAMALGKPVVCYVKDPVRARYSPDLPIVQATTDSLHGVLEQLLSQPTRREELGRMGRAYVERYHEGRICARETLAHYREIIQSKGSQNRLHGSSLQSPID